MTDCLNAKFLLGLMEQFIHVIPKPFQNQEPAFCCSALVKAESNKFWDAKVAELMRTDPGINYTVKILVTDKHANKILIRSILVSFTH